MLEKLVIKNIALFENAEINFTDGLNVLSGETGSGKSVIIDALNFVLGAKADKTLIRSGENECLVKAEFDIANNQEIIALLKENDFDEDSVLIVSRKFSIDGKSSVKINGNTVTASMLKKFTSILVDVHGQSEHFNLLKTTNQLALIDKFGGDKLLQLKSDLHNTYDEYKSVVSELNLLGGEESQRLIRLDVLNYQINEIENANLKEDEEEFLIETKQKLLHQEKINSSLYSLKSALSNEGGVQDILANASKVLNGISELGAEYSELYDRLENSFSEIRDITDVANSLLEQMEEPEYNLEDIEDRLDLIKGLKNKYGSTIDEISNFLNNATEEKERLENFNEIAQKLLDKKLDLQKNLYAKYAEINKQRIAVSKILTNNVLSELKELGMTKSDFKVVFENFPTIEDCKFDCPNGIDKIEFFFSANSGEPLKPLSMVISGGEMSRFMLAVKAQTAKYKDVSTFIFDEIDAGISGNVAKIVAEKFANISKNVQIIAITHLPQISSMADNNLLIEKKEFGDRTITQVKTLSPEEKVFEIVRLVGGDTSSTTAIEHAKDLISVANTYKKR